MPLRFSFLIPLIGLALNAVGQPSPPLPPITIPASFTAHLPYTAQLLSTINSDRPRHVRILVYGQSISEQKWWLQVKQFLQQRYPAVDIVMENRAIGGFSSDRLKLMVANDVAPFYPDLILFHDYGGEEDYEQIIRVIRSHTTAEVLIQTDHIGLGQNQEWHDQHSEVWLPVLCNTYGLALLDVRAAWKAYLQQHQLTPAALLSDNVHLNEHGNYLMAQIITRYLEALPRQTEVPVTTVQTLRRGNDFSPRKDKIRLPVDGNRIDLVWDSGSPTRQTVAVTIDNNPPDSQRYSYFYTRPALNEKRTFLSHIGQLLAMQLGGKPQAEDWTLTVTAVDTVRQQLQFRVKGSQTGDDGEGSSDQPFSSTSGQIQIDSTGWFRRKNPGDFRQFPWLKAGDQLHWKVLSCCGNSVEPVSGRVVTVMQGATNGVHVLELSGKGVQHIQEIRVYRPTLRL
jgi:hypothetical protein